jgi:hypothetical protein
VASRISEVALRNRPLPYDFDVRMTRGSESLGLYSGTSAKYAKSSYWQGVRSAVFLGLHGDVRLTVTIKRDSYGAFVTHVENGKVMSLHIPSGKCLEWADASWSEGLAEKLLATIPGMPGPIRHSG